MTAPFLELRFLGTGTSVGVPMIGCDCETCTSDDPRDQRTRPSVLISYSDPSHQPVEGDPASVPPDGVRRMLVDTGPELRQQALRERVRRVDGVFYTHTHADHVYGLDDLRRFNAVTKAPLDLYAEPTAFETLTRMFSYVFAPHTNLNKTFIPTLLAHPIEPGAPIELYGARWTPIRLMHGRLPILGYRVDFAGRSIAYCTDTSAIPPETFELLADLDLLVIDGLRYRHHPTHMTVDQALGAIDQIAPRQALLTHIAHDIRHAELEPRLPEGVGIAYDGLRVRFEAAGGEVDQQEAREATRGTK